MKRLFIWFLIASFALLPCSSYGAGRTMAVGPQLVASGNVTQANIRLSAVDGGSTASGGAFVDFTAANVLTSKIGNLLIISDSAGKKIQGYIKSAGTSETLSATETVTDTGMESWNSSTDLTNWVEELAGTSTINREATVIHGGTYAARLDIDSSNSLVQLSSSNSLSSYKLYFISVWSRSATGTPSVSWPTGNSPSQSITTTYTQYSKYWIGSNTSFTLKRNSATSNSIYFDDVSAKQVLTPSATGVTITSTKGGATYNWAAKNAAFNYNDASGYSYQVYRINSAPVIASGTCTNANAVLTLTAGSASFACTGTDYSTYQDGRYMIALYDGAGVAAYGYFKSAGSGAVINTKGGATQNFINIGSGFSTAGNFTWKTLFVGD